MYIFFPQRFEYGMLIFRWFLLFILEISDNLTLVLVCATASQKIYVCNSWLKLTKNVVLLFDDQMRELFLSINKHTLFGTTEERVYCSEIQWKCVGGCKLVFRTSKEIVMNATKISNALSFSVFLLLFTYSARF